PAGGVGGQHPDAVVGAGVEVAVARVEGQLPAGRGRQVAGDVGPALAGVGGHEHLVAGGGKDVADGVDCVAVARVHDDVGDVAQAGQVVGPVHPRHAVVLGQEDAVAVGDVDGVGVVGVGPLVGDGREVGVGRERALVGGNGHPRDAGQGGDVQAEPAAAAVGGLLQDG